MRPSENDRIFQLARQEIKRDFNLVAILRDLRFAKTSIRHILASEDKYMDLKLEARKKRLFEAKVSKKGETSSEEVVTDPFANDDYSRRNSLKNEIKAFKTFMEKGSETND